MSPMDQPQQNHARRRPVTRKGQLMLNLSGSHQMESLPEPNRSQCIALLGRMLLGVLEAGRKHTANQNHSQP